MSRSETRAARELLAVLEATEVFLRVTGATHLSYASMMAVERAAHRRAEQLLEGLSEHDIDVDDATDELLSRVVQPRPIDLVDAARQSTDSQRYHASDEPMDDGPEGSAADTNVLYSEEEDLHSSDEVARANAGGDYVSYDDPGEDGQGGYYDDEGGEYDDEGGEYDEEGGEYDEEGAEYDDEPYDDDGYDDEDDGYDPYEPGASLRADGGGDEPSYVSYDPEADTGGYGYEEEVPGVKIASDGDDSDLPVTDQGSRWDADPEPDAEPTGLFNRDDLDRHESAPASGDYVSYDEPDDTDERQDGLPGFVPELSGFDEGDDEAETQVLAIDESDLEELDDEALDDVPRAPIDYSDLDEDTMSTSPAVEDDDDVLFDDESELDIEELTLEEEDSALVETFDLMPDLEQVLEEEPTATFGGDDSDATPGPAGARVGAPRVATSQPRVAASPRASASVSTGRAAASVNPGLYGRSAVPTIRDSNAPKPRAAAVQLNAGAPGTGKVISLEDEEEPIAIGGVEDYDEELAEEYDDEPASGGFRLEVAEYEYSEPEPESLELDLDEPEPEVGPPPAPPGPSKVEIGAMFQRARAAAEAGDMQGGAELYSDVIDADPDNVEAHVGRGRLYLDLGDYTRAMSDFMVSEDLAPGNPEPQIAIGDLYFARKDYRKAIDYFNAALTMSPNHAMAFCRRGISHYYRKNYKEGLDDLVRAQKLDPDIPNIGTYISMARKKARR